MVRGMTVKGELEGGSVETEEIGVRMKKNVQRNKNCLRLRSYNLCPWNYTDNQGINMVVHVSQIWSDYE